jgi:hypothetical protein
MADRIVVEGLRWMALRSSMTLMKHTRRRAASFSNLAETTNNPLYRERYLADAKEAALLAQRLSLDVETLEKVSPPRPQAHKE